MYGNDKHQIQNNYFLRELGECDWEGINEREGFNNICDGISAGNVYKAFMIFFILSCMSEDKPK